MRQKTSKKQAFKRFKSSVKERKKKGSGYFSRAKNWFKRKMNKNQRKQNRTDRTGIEERKETRRIPVESAAEMLPVMMRERERIQERRPDRSFETRTMPVHREESAPISNTRNINSLLVLWDKGVPFVQFDADDGLKSFRLTTGNHRLNRSYTLNFEGGIISVVNQSGKIFSSKNLEKNKTLLILPSLIG